MLCPSCKQEVEKTSIYCSYCGKFAPNSKWFISENSFSCWLSELNPKKKKQSTSRDLFVCDSNYPLRYARDKKDGSGKNADEPYSVNITPEDAKGGVQKSVVVHDSKTNSDVERIIELPSGIANGQVLKLVNGKQFFYVVVNIEREFGNTGSDSGSGCAIELVAFVFILMCYYIAKYLYNLFF